MKLSGWLLHVEHHYPQATDIQAALDLLAKYNVFGHSL
jgi:hypothetical protein